MADSQSLLTSHPDVNLSETSMLNGDLPEEEHAARKQKSEDTPLRPAETSFKYVRCLCNRIETNEKFQTEFYVVEQTVVD